jgi:hypothetical protein
MSQAMRKLTGVIARSNCTVIFINQIREKIGVMFGSPETTPGGRALKFYSSVRIDIRRTGAIKDGDENVGNHVRAKVVKNKVAPALPQAEFDIMFNEGISATGDLIDLAVDSKVCEKSGSWFSYGEIRLGQGRERGQGVPPRQPRALRRDPGQGARDPGAEAHQGPRRRGVSRGPRRRRPPRDRRGGAGYHPDRGRLTPPAIASGCGGIGRRARFRS